jgi:flagellin-like protein
MMKGISPLIATVILIAVTVSIVSIIGTWVTTLTKEETGDITNKTGEATDCTGANIEIRDVYIDLSSNISRVSVWNSGYVDDSIVAALLQNEDGETAPNLTAFPLSLPRGSLKSIEFNISNFNVTNGTTACNDFSQAIVTTLCPPSAKFTGTPKCS